MLATVQRIIEEEARLTVPASRLTPSADLYALGMTPYCAVRVLLALECEFGIELPRDQLKRQTLKSMESIEQALKRVIAPAARRNAA